MLTQKLAVIVAASRVAFKRKRYAYLLFVTAIVIFFLIVFVPVVAVPGNDLLFQLSIMPVSDYVVLGVLSLLTSLSVMLNLYLLHRHKHSTGAHTGQALASSGLGLTGAFFGTITCIACASTILGFLGVGAVSVLYKYRLPVSVLASLLLIVSIYFTSKKVIGECDVCHIKKTA